MAPGGVQSKIFLSQTVLGAGYRPNNVCPKCGCNDRERLMLLFLRQVARLGEQPLRVLHVAPERQLSRYIRQCHGIQWCSIDLYEPGATANMDLTRLAFHDGTFDVAICNNVLEHIPDDRRAIAELRRVIKPGGWAIVQVPISLTLATTDEDINVCSPQERIDRFGQDDHVRMYAWDFFDRMDSSGFEVQLYGYRGDPKTAALPAGLKLHVCFKRPAKAFLPAHPCWTVNSPESFGLSLASHPSRVDALVPG